MSGISCRFPVHLYIGLSSSGKIFLKKKTQTNILEIMGLFLLWKKKEKKSAVSDSYWWMSLWVGLKSIKSNESHRSAAAKLSMNRNSAVYFELTPYPLRCCNYSQAFSFHRIDLKWTIHFLCHPGFSWVIRFLILLWKQMHQCGSADLETNNTVHLMHSIPAMLCSDREKLFT